MAEPVFYGICSNCMYARTCRYALNAAQPVHFCDMYEVSGKAVKDPRAEDPHRRTSQDGEAAGRFRGLCVDCVKRNDCEKAGTESGVWHCREYQGKPD